MKRQVALLIATVWVGLFAVCTAASVCDEWVAALNLANPPRASTASELFQNATQAALNQIQAGTFDLRRYFDGSSGRTNRSSALTSPEFRYKIASWLGMRLNCSGFDSNYTGRSMRLGHLGMSVTHPDLVNWADLFVAAFRTVLLSNRVNVSDPQLDSLRDTMMAARAGLVRNGITLQQQSACDQYSDNLSLDDDFSSGSMRAGPNIPSLSLLADLFLANISTASHPLRSFFDGSRFLVDPATGLVTSTRMRAFFSTPSTSRRAVEQTVAFFEPAQIQHEIDATRSFATEKWEIHCDGTSEAAPDIPGGAVYGPAYPDASYGSVLKFGQTPMPYNPPEPSIVLRAQPNNIYHGGSPRCEMFFNNLDQSLPRKKVFWSAWRGMLSNFSHADDSMLFNQWFHGLVGAGLNPPMGITVTRGILTLTLRYSTVVPTMVKSDQIVLDDLIRIPAARFMGKPINVVIQSKLSPYATDGGFFRLWIDGEQLLNYNGPVGYAATGAREILVHGIYPLVKGNILYDIETPNRMLYVSKSIVVWDEAGRYTVNDMNNYLNGVQPPSGSTAAPTNAPSARAPSRAPSSAPVRAPSSGPAPASTGGVPQSQQPWTKQVWIRQLISALGHSNLLNCTDPEFWWSRGGQPALSTFNLFSIHQPMRISKTQADLFVDEVMMYLSPYVAAQPLQNATALLRALSDREIVYQGVNPQPTTAPLGNPAAQGSVNTNGATAGLEAASHSAILLMAAIYVAFFFAL